MILNIINILISMVIAILIPVLNGCSPIEYLWIPVIYLASYLALNLLFWIIAILFSFTSSAKKEYLKPNKFYGRLLNFILEMICLTFRIKIEITGLEKLNNDKFLLVCNHRSNFDDMVLSSVIKRPELSFISKPQNFDIPFAGRYMRRCAYLPIDTKDPRKAMKAINDAVTLIKEYDSSIGVFPEGRRCKGPDVEKFSDGCFMIAKKADCQIVVATVQGTEKVKNRFPKKTTVKLDFLAVISREDVKNMRNAELSAYAKGLMHNNIMKEEI